MALHHVASPPSHHLPSPLHDSYASHISLRGASHHQHLSASSSPADADYSTFDDVDINGPIRPPPSALTASTTTAYNAHDSPSPLEDYPSAPRSSHVRSPTKTFFDNCQPFLSRAQSTLQQHTSRASLHAPTKSLASFIPTRTAIESAGQPKIKAGAKALQNWFNGSSAPVSLGVRRQEDDDDDYSESGEEYDSDDSEDEEHNMINIFTRGPALTGSTDSTPTKAAPTPQTKPQSQTPTSTASSKFAWLLNTQKNASLPPPQPSPTYHNPSDELLNLNISTTLFPHGPVDPLDPHSFNDLLSNAEALLSRYQTAYRQLSSALNDTRAEQGAQDDELEEAETRNRHLKMQLETMATRANEQDDQMRRLMEELQHERRARKEEEAARKRSLALIRAPNGQQCAAEEVREGGRRRNRVSNSDVSVDSGFESEAESDAASVFSRTNCVSPTNTAPSSAPSIAEEPEDTPKGSRVRPAHTQRRSTYDRVRDGTADSGWGCQNCEGGAQASVWGRLSREREENNILKRRVETLEDAVESALGVVDGPWGIR